MTLYCGTVLLWYCGTFQGLPSSPGLLLPGLTQVRVEPATESVLLVPGALAVTDQHQLVRSHPHADVLYGVFPGTLGEITPLTMRQ